MNRKREQSITDLLHYIMREDGLETPYNEYKAVKAWDEIMGEGVVRYTGEVSVHGGVMYVQIKSPALRQNLMMARRELVQRINQHIGAQTLQNIVFR